MNYLIFVIIVIAVASALLQIPERYQKLLYLICVVLFILWLAAILGVLPAGDIRILR